MVRAFTRLSKSNRRCCQPDQSSFPAVGVGGEGELVLQGKYDLFYLAVVVHHQQVFHQPEEKGGGGGGRWMNVCITAGCLAIFSYVEGDLNTIPNLSSSTAAPLRLSTSLSVKPRVTLCGRTAADSFSVIFPFQIDGRGINRNYKSYCQIR